MEQKVIQIQEEERKKAQRNNEMNVNISIQAIQQRIGQKEVEILMLNSAIEQLKHENQKLKEKILELAKR